MNWLTRNWKAAGAGALVTAAALIAVLVPKDRVTATRPLLVGFKHGNQGVWLDADVNRTCGFAAA